MNNFKGLLLGAVAASVFTAGAMITPAHAGSHSESTATIGHKGGAFYVKSKDGNYSAIAGMKFQFDSTFAVNDDTFTLQADTHAFDAPRIHAGLKGRAGSPNLTYSLLYDFENSGIIDYSMSYKFNPLLTVKVGNYKSLGIHAGNRTSSSSGWLVDNPNGWGDVATGRNVGASILGKYANVAYEAKISQGGDTGVETGTKGIMANFGLAYEPFGKYGGFSDPDYSAKNKLRMLFSGGYEVAQNSAGDGDFATYSAAANNGTANLDYWHGLVGLKYAGLALTATYEHGNMQTSENDSNGDNQNGRRSYAYFLGATYMLVPKKIPFSVTYSVLDPDSEAQVGGDNNGGGVDAAALGIQRQVGVGAAYLINGHRNKFHASWQRLSTDVATRALDGGNETNDVDHSFNLRWQVTF
jgi:hypothetical protein